MLSNLKRHADVGVSSVVTSLLTWCSSSLPCILRRKNTKGNEIYRFAALLLSANPIRKRYLNEQTKFRVHLEPPSPSPRPQRRWTIVCCTLNNSSARWNTSPANVRSNAALVGTVACAAGPSAALSGVAGTLVGYGELPDPVRARWR